ncbi:GNAT family N-acetyltransferase [Enterococcus sp. HY326]|uniref:GNAT family N-acetyltransferase n=1 Tax=Enterococcus sp. HY326 TaxID=2971265 RepID=UPI00223FC142|nr:GNAT family N-acetyltransferase [Enterococcus sp. HY326]
MIRFAKREDGPAIVDLLMIIFKDMELAFVKEQGADLTKEIMLEAMEDATYRYAYGNGLVDEIDGQVAGVSFGYGDDQEDQIDQAFQKLLPAYKVPSDQQLFIEKETFPNEWYLDSIAVNPQFQGHGIGSSLLSALPQLAHKADKKIIGLSVDTGNPLAKKLYTRQGFKVVGEKILSGHLYEHMQKEL